MATKRDGEKYLGQALHVPLSSDGQVAAYVWPLRILRAGAEGIGGPTIGIDVGNEEVLRFDCHDTPGHWHAGGYDRMGTPGNSHRNFPDGIERVADQLSWAMRQITEKGKELLKEAEYTSAADTLNPALVRAGLKAIQTHLENEGDLRSQAIKDNLIAN